MTIQTLAQLVDKSTCPIIALFSLLVIKQCRNLVPVVRISKPCRIFFTLKRRLFSFLSYFKVGESASKPLDKNIFLKFTKNVYPTG
jgi:hypothetical protein